MGEQVIHVEFHPNPLYSDLVEMAVHLQEDGFTLLRTVPVDSCRSIAVFTRASNTATPDRDAQVTSAGRSAT